MIATLVVLPGLAHGQSASPQTAQTPWSLHDALGISDSFGVRASLRSRVETIDEQARPAFNGNDTILDLRTTLFAEYRTGPFRIGGEIYDSRSYFTNARTPIGTNDVNVAELVQAYAALDLGAPFGARSMAKVQVGRMTLNLGSRRLVSSEDWRNTTNGYTGVRGDIGLAGGIVATLVYVLPTVRLPDDLPSLLENRFALDRESTDTVLWGGVASKARAIGGASVELAFYHFGERDRAGRPTRDRSLNTFGARVFREPSPGKFDFEVEALYQSGTISSSTSSNAPTQHVSASFVHADLGYTFAMGWKPHLSLRFDRASGDSGGSTYGRFDTLYGMRGAELAQAGLYSTVGRANLLSPGIFLELAPDKQTDLFIHYRPLWLASRTDSFSTSNVRDPSGRSGNFAGNQAELRWRHWLVMNALRLEVNAIYLAKGQFLRSAPNAPATGNTRYAAFSMTAYF